MGGGLLSGLEVSTSVGAVVTSQVGEALVYVEYISLSHGSSVYVSKVTWTVLYGPLPRPRPSHSVVNGCSHEYESSVTYAKERSEVEYGTSYSEEEDE